jgi:hypothetical protein
MHARCLLTVIDASTRYSWHIPLKLKSAAASKLQCLIVHLEKVFDANVRVFQSDQGGKFSSNLLATWFLEHGTGVRVTPTQASN